MHAEKPGPLQYSQVSQCQRPGGFCFFFFFFFLPFFLADVHLKVGAKMSDAVEIDSFAPF